MPANMIALLVMGLIFDFINGIHDSSNIVATMISSHALSPRWSLTVIALAEFAGPLIFGVAVAKTVGGGIVLPDYVTMNALLAAVGSAILWGLFTWYLGIPSSASHAVIGGLIGAVVMSNGWHAVYLNGIIKVLIILFTSPLIGLIVGYLVTKLVILASWKATPRVNEVFKKGQVATSVALALSYGANDAQKTMGILTLGLLTSGVIQSFNVPFWVVLSCASMIAFGTMVGGWRLIRTLGAKFFKIRPMDGFSTQLASTAVILGASFFGGLVSTTQVVSTAIMGVGSAERMNKVRWGVAKDIVVAWVLTIPATAVIGAGLLWLILRVL
jgi:PiT family inorganic phosphate transporter